MKKRILSILIAVIMLMQLFTVSVLAADISVTLTLDNEAKTVTIAAENLKPSTNYALRGYYGETMDYINQFKSDADGKYSCTYPSAQEEWENGAIITVYVGTAKFEVVVDKGVDPVDVLATGIKINGSALVTVKKGNTVTLTATVTPDDATNKTVKWTTSNAEVATIDSNGVVKGLKVGIVIIKAETTDGTGLTSVMTVRVTP